MIEYSTTDSTATLTKQQLELITESDHDFVIDYLKTRTRFDAEKIRLILELGCIEAKKRLSTF